MYLEMEGISFVIRVRNEENTLDECLSSLTGLTMPHEILEQNNHGVH